MGAQTTKNSEVQENMRSQNPLRSEVLHWYHKIGKCAFTVPWASDDDAMYVLSEARRLFRQNQFVTDVKIIERKIREAEMRYHIALHYMNPYPRPFHKTQGSTQESGVAYHPAYDSMLDCAGSPRLGDNREGCATQVFKGGNGDPSGSLLDEVRGVSDTVDGRLHYDHSSLPQYN